MEVIQLDGKNTEAAARRAADVLRKGGIVAYPTDTVYGLGVDPWNPGALELLKGLKGRERKKPISVIVPDVAHIDACAEMNETARKFADAHLPGPLTLVMTAKHMPEAVMLHGTIGVRVPNDAFCLALGKVFGHPYTTTSANKTSTAVPQTADALMRHFGHELHKIALIIDGGPRTSTMPSTVVSCIGPTPHVLREGALSREQLGL
ncbi:MAG: L-threonylcarbamoyladenylate synthase [Minisyncoccia bacterium]